MHKSYPALLALFLLRALTTPAASGEVSTAVTVTVVSTDGTVITPNSMSGAAAAQSENAAAPASKGITTAEGRWTFGTPANASGDYPILLNGSNANGGFADLLQVTNRNLYARQKSGQWWVRYNAGWHATAAGPVEGTVASAVSLSVRLPKIPDNAPAGTVVATAQMTMSPAAAQFTGALISSSALFAARGKNIVLARALTSADDALSNSTITAVQ